MHLEDNQPKASNPKDLQDRCEQSVAPIANQLVPPSAPAEMTVRGQLARIMGQMG